MKDLKRREIEKKEDGAIGIQRSEDTNKQTLKALHTNTRKETKSRKHVNIKAKVNYRPLSRSRQEKEVP